MMQMINLLKNIKRQNGSITLFVLLAILFFLIVCVSIYYNGNNRRTAQIKEIEQIENSYSYSEEKIEEIYNKALLNLEI